MSNNNAPGVTIEEGNRLIAEFMDFDISGNIKWIQSDRTEKKRLIETPGDVEDLEYHSNWNWLMPVYIKISKLCADKRDDFVFIHHSNELLGKMWRLLEEETLTIEQFWQLNIDFIQWYNTQTPQP